jgi:hypothetical protein
MPQSTVGPVNHGTKTDATLDQALTAFLTLSTRGYERLFLSLAITAQATDQFTIGVKTREEQAAYTVTHSAAGDFTTPILPLVFASESFVDIAADDTPWLIMDVRGIDQVQFSLAYAVDNGAYLAEWGLQ